MSVGLQLAESDSSKSRQRGSGPMRGPEKFCCLKKICKKGLTRLKSRHIGRSTGGDALTFPRSPTDTDVQSPGRKNGEGWLSAVFVGEIFDIVGLDEGTCGRRRLVSRSSRPRGSVNVKSFQTCPSRIHYVIDLCRNGSLKRVSLWLSGFWAGAAVGCETT